MNSTDVIGDPAKRRQIQKRMCYLQALLFWDLFYSRLCNLWVIAPFFEDMQLGINREMISESLTEPLSLVPYHSYKS